MNELHNFSSRSSKNLVILLIALNGFASELPSDDRKCLHPYFMCWNNGLMCNVHSMLQWVAILIYYFSQTITMVGLE